MQTLTSLIRDRYHSPISAQRNVTDWESGHGVFKASKKENIERCVQLLEHIADCRDVGSCKEREGCLRTKRVLAHYRVCLMFTRGLECAICYQFLALCYIHTQRCQIKERGCGVPTCRNEKEPALLRKLDENTLNLKQEKLRQVSKELRKALQLPGGEERKRSVNQLLEREPIMTSRLLKLCRRKPNTSKTLRKLLVGRTAEPAAAAQVDCQPLTWQAKLLCVPV